jgi:integral membrane sensor domain MASE1
MKRDPLLQDISITLGIAAVYFVAGKLGLSLAFVNASTSAVWAPTGIALALSSCWAARRAGRSPGAFL